MGVAEAAEEISEDQVDERVGVEETTVIQEDEATGVEEVEAQPVGESSQSSSEDPEDESDQSPLALVESPVRRVRARLALKREESSSLSEIKSVNPPNRSKESSSSSELSVDVGVEVVDEVLVADLVEVLEAVFEEVAGLEDQEVEVEEVEVLLFAVVLVVEVLTEELLVVVSSSMGIIAPTIPSTRPLKPVGSSSSSSVRATWRRAEPVPVGRGGCGINVPVWRTEVGRPGWAYHPPEG